MSPKRHLTFKILLFLIATDLLETFAQFCFKKSTAYANFPAIISLSAAVSFLKPVVFSPFLWLAFSSVLIIFTIWAVILSKIDLSVAVPVASLSYILVPLVSGVFLHEKISLLRWSGIAFILIGVILVSITSRHKKEAV